MPSVDRSLQGQIAVHTSWANTTDRSARTAPGRRAMWEKFLLEVDPEGVMPLADREKAAEAKRKAFYLAMSRKSAAVRAARKAKTVDHAEKVAELRARRSA